MTAPDQVISLRGIAAGGDAVGTLPDGRTVFVPRGAPGDSVTLRQVRLHRRFARARIDRVVDPAPGRVDPPCPHYLQDDCGGCQLMHLDIAAQRAAKSRIVGDALRRIARIDVADPEVVPAPAPLNYRTKVTLTVERGVIGFHRLVEAGGIFEVGRCRLLDPALEELHQLLRQSRELLPANAARVTLRLDAAGGSHVLVQGSGEGGWNRAAELHRALGGSVVVWWHPEGGVARAVAGSDDPWPAAVFEQVNPSVAESVRQLAVAAVGQGQGVAWDLYSGIGETTLLLARHWGQVESIELDRRAVELAERLGPPGPRRLAGDVAELLPRLARPEVVVANPPRAGLGPAVAQGLAQCGAGTISYISCDPATLARDLAVLAPTYRLAALTAFDQFPQTAHVEVLAVLVR